MKHAVRAALRLVVILGATPLLLAKGPTTKITITSTDRESANEIRNREILENFHVWAGPGTFVNDVEGNEGFIVDWASGVVIERPSGLRRYEVAFYVRYANRPFDEQADQLAYVIAYESDPVTGQGYVYLPGKTDERYRLNTKAIYHGREGNWFRATPAWQDAFRRATTRP